MWINYKQEEYITLSSHQLPQGYTCQIRQTTHYQTTSVELSKHEISENRNYKHLKH